MGSKSERTRSLRYKKAALASLGYYEITNELYDIMEASSDVQYYMDGDDETLLNALDGDEEAEYEFKIAFCDLSAKAEQLFELVQDSGVQENFDDCTVSLIGNRYKTIGFDSEEEDYFSLTSYEQDLAYTESGKRLMRHTKPEIISIIGQCLGIVIAFLDLRHSYDYLKATMDILRDENTSLYKTVKEIDVAYEKANKAEFLRWIDDCKKFDQLINGLPDRAWLE